MPPAMRFVSIDKSGLVNVAAGGDLDGYAGCDDRNPLKHVLGAKWASHRILLDLSEIEHMGTSTIGWLISCQKSLKHDGGTLVLHSASQRVRQLLSMLNVQKMIPVARDEAAGKLILIGVPHDVHN